ncbi:MAG: DUF6338 family protein [Alphaproteobacteria bacterium]
MSLETFDAVYLALAFIVPGFIAHSVQAIFSIRKTASYEINLIRFLTLSALNYATWSWLIFLLGNAEFFKESIGWTAAGWAWVILAGPVLLGGLLGYLSQKDVVHRFLQKIGLRPIHGVPTSWDWRFSQLTAHWILITLKDGSSVSGWFGEKSFASSDSEERDIYVEQVYEINDQGKWQRAAVGKGILIAANEIKFIELWPPEEKQNESG